MKPLWSGKSRTPVWKPVTPGVDAQGRLVGPWCECQRPAAWELTVPQAGKGQTTLLLCERCAQLERALSAGSSWSE